MTSDNNSTAAPAETTTNFVSTEALHVIGAQSFQKYWTPKDLNILGAFLWIAIVLTLIGNISCFYAVYKNIKKILEHPFFQSNILCILLSAADVLLVLLVGVPAAIFFCTAKESNTRNAFLNEHLGNGFYNLAIVEALLDYFVWLQLLLIVAICVDRCGHICKPLTYTFSITTGRAAIACFLCIIIPFLLQTLPYIVMVEGSIRHHVKTCEPADLECVFDNSFKCDMFGEYETDDRGTDIFKQEFNVELFLTCTVSLPSKEAGEGESRKTNLYKMQWWESISHPLMLFLAALALLGSNCLIIYKLVKSSNFRKNNMNRPASIRKEEIRVTRMVQLNTLVALVQAVLLLASTLPLRIFQIEDKLHLFYLEKCSVAENMDKYYCGFHRDNYHPRYLLIAKVLVFLGPMCNPWLYPIRMASIRNFLSAKKQSVVSSARRLTLSSRASTFRMKRTKKNKYVAIEAEVKELPNDYQLEPEQPDTDIDDNKASSKQYSRF